MDGVFNHNILELIGIILLSYSSLDRIFGYGLKFDKGFKFTHLEELGEINAYQTKSLKSLNPSGQGMGNNVGV